MIQTYDHPADELLVVRSEITALEVRAEELRQRLLDLPESQRSTSMCRVEVTRSERERFDLKRFRLDWAKLAQEYTHVNDHVVVKVTRK